MAYYNDLKPTLSEFTLRAFRNVLEFVTGVTQ